MKGHSAFYKLDLIKLYLHFDTPISVICRLNNLSRKSFYVWFKAYIKCKKNDQKFLLSQVTIKKHWRRHSYKNEFKVLRLVEKNPGYSCHNLSSILKQRGSNLSHHAVQNILNRYHLNTLDKRLLWAKSES